jgi:hypothetical protein
LQFHPLLWWAGLRKVREKYHIYIYLWNCRIIKEICIKYNIYFYLLSCWTHITCAMSISTLVNYWRKKQRAINIIILSILFGTKQDI